MQDAEAVVEPDVLFVFDRTLLIGLVFQLFFVRLHGGHATPGVDDHVVTVWCQAA